MHILAIDTYHGGSHRAFINNWIQHSRHRWTLLTLPAHHWKWRMRHAPIYFAEQLAAMNTTDFDTLLVTDMLNLAEFRGLVREPIRRLPCFIYFHENQLMYPDQQATEKDLHYAFTNVNSALAADRVWFNSAWHRDSFLQLGERWLKRMPDFQPLSALQQVRQKSSVSYPGIEVSQTVGVSDSTDPSLSILWAARWETDKNPQQLFRVLRSLRQCGVDFKLNLVGGRAADRDRLFSAAREEFKSAIQQWGYLDDRQQYLELLGRTDLVVSTALHEFFGIAVLEGVANGCVPLVPNRLAYPETLAVYRREHPECFYDGSDEQLLQRLQQFALQKQQQKLKARYADAARTATAHLHWPVHGTVLDQQLHRQWCDIEQKRDQ